MYLSHQRRNLTNVLVPGDFAGPQVSVDVDDREESSADLFAEVDGDNPNSRSIHLHDVPLHLVSRARIAFEGGRTEGIVMERIKYEVHCSWFGCADEV